MTYVSDTMLEIFAKYRFVGRQLRDIRHGCLIIRISSNTQSQD
jgi:hypothetical protein